MYRPNETKQMTTPIKLLIPTITNELGVNVKTYTPAANPILMCNYKTYGGTETKVNGVVSIEDTAQITTWYRDDIKSGCAIETTDGKRYEIEGQPENIEMRNQFIVFKIKRIKGDI